MPKDEGSSSHILLEEIQALYSEAEGCMKALEHTHGLYVPTVNQLRYAGRHLIDFLNGSKTPDEELRKARSHCQRAIFDAHDAHVQFQLFEIESFKDDFKDVEITDVLPKYFDMLKAASEALKFLEEGRTKGDNRDVLYKKCEDHRATLAGYVDQLPHAREELNKRQTSKRNNALYGQIGAWSSVIAAIAAIVALVFQVF